MVQSIITKCNLETVAGQNSYCPATVINLNFRKNRIFVEIISIKTYNYNNFENKLISIIGGRVGGKNQKVFQTRRKRH